MAENEKLTSAEEYDKRGDSYYDKGACDHAIEDHSQAIRLD